MDYTKMTKEQLIQNIEEIQILNQQLLEEKEQEIGLNFSWTGNLGHWYWNFKTNNVTFNPLKITTLGYTEEEIPEKVDYQFFTEKLHPEDYQKTMDAMLDHLYGKSSVYEIEYRIKTKEGSYKWYYDRGKITKYDDSGKPLLIAGIVFDITEKKEMQLDLEVKNKLLDYQSSTDGLTMVSNHRVLIEHLKDEMVIALQEKLPLSIVMFDIDDFKRVNDTKGHVYGDTVLIAVADIMQKSVRESDLVGRYGGEEFMILFPKINLEDATAISERIRQSIQKYYINDDIKITISGGVQEYNGESLSDFIHSADTNLYKAKISGKNKII
jgi:diguanylate cyclase (GGDEF)-like protein/PAS domain S-box-containing protein